MLGSKGAVALEDFKPASGPAGDWTTVPGYELTPVNWQVLRNISGASAVFAGTNEVTLTATANTVSGDVLITGGLNWTFGDFRAECVATIVSASRNAGNKFLGFHAYLVGDGTPDYPADVSAWPADGSDITSVPITSNTVSDHTRGIVHFTLQCVNPGVLPGSAMRMRIMDFDPNTLPVSGWVPDEAYAEDVGVQYKLVWIRRGSNWAYIRTNLTTGEVKQANITLPGIGALNDGRFGFRVWDGNSVKLTNMKIQRWTGSEPPPPPDDWTFGTSWQQNWVLHAATAAVNDGRIRIVQNGDSLDIFTEMSESGSVGESMMLVSKAKLPTEDHQIELEVTTLDEPAVTGPNGVFNRLWAMKGEGTTAYPADVAKWNGNYVPGNSSVRPHATGILATWNPYNSQVATNSNKVRVHGFDKSDAMSDLANSSPTDFPFSKLVPYQFRTTKAGNSIAFRAVPSASSGESTVDFDTGDVAEIGSRYGGNLAISVTRRCQRIAKPKVSLFTAPPPKPPIGNALTPPRVNTSGYVDYGTATAAQLNAKINAADSLTNGKIRLTSDITSGFTVSKRMADGKELAIDMQDNALVNTEMTCNQMQGITWHNGRMYGSTKASIARFDCNGGANACRWSDIECRGAAVMYNFDFNYPRETISNIILDRITVDRTFYTAPGAPINWVPNEALCGSGGGVIQGWCKIADDPTTTKATNSRGYLIYGILFKRARSPGGISIGGEKGTNGYNVDVDMVRCRFTKEMSFCYQYHWKCGYIRMYGCDYENDSGGWAFLTRHGVNIEQYSAYLRSNAPLLALDYDGVFANCLSVSTSGGIRVMAGNQISSWKKGTLPAGVTFFFPRSTNTILWNNRGPAGCVQIGNPSDTDNVPHFPPDNVQVYPHPAGVVVKDDKAWPGTTWVNKTGLPPQFIQDRAAMFDPKPLVEGVDCGRGAL